MRSVEEIRNAVTSYGKLLRESNDGNGCMGFVRYRGATLRFIASWGYGWDHVSISLADRCPRWEEMSLIKRLFFKPEEVAMELHPAEADYVNNHPYVLHIWRPQGEAIPLPPKWMV